MKNTHCRVFINENLNWKHHFFKIISGKIARSIGILSKSKFFLSKSSLIKLYYTLIYPYLYYGNIVWGSTYPTTLDRLNVLHKRAIRIITMSNFDAHTAPLFYENKLLNLKHINNYQTGTFMYRFHNKLLPKSFQNMFELNSNIHSLLLGMQSTIDPTFVELILKSFLFYLKAHIFGTHSLLK